MFNDKILTEGYLYNCFDNCIAGKNPNITTTQLSLLTTIYGELYKKGDLYDLLFVGENETIQLKNKVVNTKDIAAFTLMRYLFRPKAYWKDDKGAMYRDPAYGPGVPLALLGARNLHNVPYMSWAKNVDKENLESVYKVDLFLGWTFASTTMDIVTGRLSWRGNGLVKFLGFPMLFDIHGIRELRGDYPLNSYATRKIEDSTLDNIEFYNEANTEMRHLLRQTWCWAGKNRSTNMILDYRDWDYVAKDVDKVSLSILGHAPAKSNVSTGIMRRLGMQEALKYDEPPRNDV